MKLKNDHTFSKDIKQNVGGEAPGSALTPKTLKYGIPVFGQISLNESIAKTKKVDFV